MPSSAILTALVQALPVATVLLEPPGIVVAVNDAWVSLAVASGYPEAEGVLGRSYGDVCEGACALDASFASRLRHLVAELLGGERNGFVVQDRTGAADGSVRWLQVVARRVRDGERDAALLLHLDVVEARGELEARIERLQHERWADLNRANVLLQYEADERRRLAAERDRLQEELLRAHVLLGAVAASQAAAPSAGTSDMRYRLASRAINDAIWDWDVTTGRVDWSDGIFLRFGHPHDTVVATLDWWLANLHPLDRERVRTSLDAALEGASESWQDEYRFRRFDGSWADVVDRGFIVRDVAGRALRAVGAMEDVTERRRAEAERAALLDRERGARAEAEAANRAKDEFLAVVSHELRTPLSPILGFVDVLREQDLGATDASAALDAIERNARALKHLIDDLLDVSRITSGKLSLEYAPFRLRDAVTAVLESVRPSALVKGLRLEVSLADDDGVIAGDARRLAQVAANLLSNAVKFTPRGGSIRVSVAGEGESAVLVVSDTGKGIPPNLLPYVFERFRQGDTSDTRVHGGLGLGLAIVRYIVDMHGGTISVESAGEDRGTTFTVSFPLLRHA